MVNFKIVALVLEDYWDWFMEKQHQNQGLTFAVGKSSIIVDLEISTRVGSTETYLIPIWLVGAVDIRINTWEYGCNGMAVVIANFTTGEKLKPLRIKDNGGMAMFSTNKGFTSVTAIGKNLQRVEIVKHSIWTDGQKIVHSEETVFKGRWRGKACKTYSRYSKAVLMATTRAQMKQNPEAPLFV